MLTKRIATSIALSIFLFATVFIDWLCGLMVTAFIVAGLLEFFNMLEKKSINNYKYFGTAMGALIPLSIVHRFELTRSWEVFFIVVALLSLILMQFRRRESEGVVVSISTTVFGILYVSWFLSFLIKIRYLQGGLWLFFTVILITKLGDIGAYLIGMRFGKTPLIPRISPKKSVEGSIGGLVFSLAGALICRDFLKLSLPQAAIAGVLFGILAQLGDLSESLMKRDCQVKDSGFLLPGMGGVLDLADSLIFTAPAFYFYMSFILK
jgi:phosphatidate cytidylyltransferase